MLAMRFSVASPRSPPKATMGARLAKYRKMIVETLCMDRPSLKMVYIDYFVNNIKTIINLGQHE